MKQIYLKRTVILNPVYFLIKVTTTLLLLLLEDSQVC